MEPESSPSKMNDLPWLPFNGIIDGLVDSLGFRKVIKLREINRAFNREILDILLSRCRIDALGLREQNLSGYGETFAHFTWIPDTFMSQLVIYGMQEDKLQATDLTRWIKSLAARMCELEGNPQTSSRLLIKSICQGLFKRGSTHDMRRAVFKDGVLDLSTIPESDALLSIASSIGRVGLIENIIGSGFDISKCTENRILCRPLTAAAKEGHKEACRFLLEHGADPNAVDPDLARQRNAQTSHSQSRLSAYCDDALRAACRAGHLSIVELLFQPEYKLQFHPGFYDVMIVLASSGHLEILYFLFGRAEFSLLEKKLGVKMLFAAAQNGHTSIIKDLLDAGMDVNVEQIRGEGGPIEKAASWGRESTVQFLFDRGAKLCRTSRFQSALGSAAGNGDLKMMELLIEHGAEINEDRPSDRLPLSCAAAKRQLDAMAYLLERGADIKHRHCGIKALVDAARLGHKDVVHVLIQAGVQIDGEDETLPSDFRSPVLAAKIGGYPLMVKFLLEAGAKDIDPLETEWKEDFLDGSKPYPQAPSPLLRP